MNKNQLIEEIAKQAKLKKDEASQALSAVIQIITESLKNDEEIYLPGFGKFKVVKRAPTKGRNPRTGDPIDIPAKNVPSFIAGSALKEAVNS